MAKRVFGVRRPMIAPPLDVLVSLRGDIEAFRALSGGKEPTSVQILADNAVRLDDQSLINGVSQIAPFDPASKQALLEAVDLPTRCELLIQLMQFYGLRDDGDEIVTLQ